MLWLVIFFKFEDFKVVLFNILTFLVFKTFLELILELIFEIIPLDCDERFEEFKWDLSPPKNQHN